MDVTALTQEQLESLAYRQIRQLDQTQANLRILNTEIEKRMAQSDPAIELPPVNPE